MKSENHPCLPQLVEAVDLLAERIRQVKSANCWQRLEQPVSEDVSLLAWLAAGQGFRVYWSNRDASREAAGCGVAFSVKVDSPGALDECQRQLDEVFLDCPDARFYGGLAFSSKKEDQWPGFGGELVLPRFELSRRGETLILACHVFLTGSLRDVLVVEELSQQVKKLIGLGRFPRALPSAEVAYECPDWSAWQAQVRQALAALNRGDMAKVVLSREQGLRLHGGLCPWSMLYKWQQLTPQTYRFGFCNEKGQCFFGASPECLYLRHNRELHSEALAGTAPRGYDDVQDRRLAATLLADDKNRRENALVMQAIRDALQRCCKFVEPASDTILVKLRSVQHLRQSVCATLRDETTDAQLLNLLHPTPAVGGIPKQAALDFIARVEGYPRGWYTGPFGSIEHDGAEFSVAIRSAFLEGSRLTLFSGAGLVPGSSASAEWAELDSKLRTVQSLLHIDL